MTPQTVLMFKALSDPNRLKIMELLLKGETCGCTLIHQLSISQPTLSYHLRILTQSGLVKAYKEGTWVKHTVDRDRIKDLISVLDDLSHLKAACDAL
ncbi:MAG: metalloregulator ArsR/SmtB family transcription factor [Acholeplasmataceae bacterium]|nr:metalloregulator ArsR/SmtB family transcription factor [Acholeplasmataceae bacterium]